MREGILESLANGTGVTAKISWLTGTPGEHGHSRSDVEGKSRWIHCTPLMGSDEKVGVWMIVMVEKEEVTGRLNRYRDEIAYNSNPGSVTGSGGGRGGSLGAGGGSNSRFTGSKLYAEYLRREGRSDTKESQKTSSSTRERREVDAQFRDF